MGGLVNFGEADVTKNARSPTRIGGVRSTSAPTLRRLVHLLARQSAREAISDAATPGSSAERDTLHPGDPKNDLATSSDGAMPKGDLVAHEFGKLQRVSDDDLWRCERMNRMD